MSVNSTRKVNVLRVISAGTALVSLWAAVSVLPEGDAAADATVAAHTEVEDSATDAAVAAGGLQVPGVPLPGTDPAAGEDNGVAISPGAAGGSPAQAVPLTGGQAALSVTPATPATPATPVSPAGPAATAPAVPLAPSPVPGTAGTGTNIAITPGGTAGFPGTGEQLEQKQCPLGLPKPGPEQQGGLGSMISISRVFGPFSSEVFALGAAMQPVLQLFGPVLAELEPVLEENTATLDPLLDQVISAETVILQAILPLYGPYREQFIAQEVEFTQRVIPVLQEVYASEISACFVAWQAQVLNGLHGRSYDVISPTRPGTVHRFTQVDAELKQGK